MAVEPVPAATVILLREGTVSPEVLLLERHSKSDFLPDLYVFPGGRVDPADHELARELPAENAHAPVPDCDPELARALIVAAIRETYEEAGILLARPKGGSELIDAAHSERLNQHRLDVQGGRASFRELIADEGLELASDLLSVHAHWITPEAVPKRFDTYFFGAIAPAGQVAHHDGVESTDHVWIRPEDALEQSLRKKRRMIFPTLMNLETVAGFANPDAALAASHARPVVPVVPTVQMHEGERRLVISTEAGYSRSWEVLARPPS
jgi:8-oxo-dGTP pyrophosphatase MutT (NUDIX family)